MSQVVSRCLPAVPACYALCAGLYAVGLLVLYVLLRSTWSSAYIRLPSGRPSNAFQLDLLVVKGLVCSYLGAHVVHGLWGAWLPWLLGWLAWCALQLRLQLHTVSSFQSCVSVMLVAFILPVALSLVPFRPSAIEFQEWATEALPVPQHAPGLGQLLGMATSRSS
jgi:hypothetical protein